MKESGTDREAPWTTRKLLTWTTNHFGKKGVDSARLSAEMLLAHVLGVPRLKLYMDQDRPASELERAAFRDLVERAATHEPVDYLIGQTPFFSMMLKVCPAVLIPRTSTETVVEHLVQHARHTPGFHHPLIADIGCGCGTIAIAVAKYIPHCRVIATDISAQALAIARQNAEERNVTDDIDFCEGDLLDPLNEPTRKIRYLVSNPPYISDDEWQQVPPNVKDYEPASALRGGLDGLKYLRPLIEQAHQHLDHPGQLVLEIAASQKAAVLKIVEKAAGLTNAHVLADHEGLPRVLVADST